MKATAVAPSNIAFIKYWGKVNDILRLPTNASISVNLSNIKTTTSVEFSDSLVDDEVMINNEQKIKETARVIKFLNLIRKMAKINLKARVESKNNFPKASGLASSASGFAALTLAASKAAGLKLSEKQLTILARLGSGSACRSIPDGFVEWYKGHDNDSSYAASIFPHDHWDISIIAVLVKSQEKKVGSTDGQRLVKTSPFFDARLSKIDSKLDQIKKLIDKKNFEKFGQLVEDEALELHSIMLTSQPSLIYWQPTTIKIMKFTQELRSKGLSVFFTIDAGPHLYLICEGKDEKIVIDQLKTIKEIQKIIPNKPSFGAKLLGSS